MVRYLFVFTAVSVKLTSFMLPFVSARRSAELSGEIELYSMAPLILPPVVICVSFQCPPSR